MRSDILRKKFLDFFAGKKHKIIPSDSLVPKDDPTVLFTPAGMNQFKPQFLGNITDFRRAATSQRCLRTDDLDKVGKTAGHHTFFEMLGNFSFGDYFKQEAIYWAWEFLTEELKLGKDKLWVSVYRDDNEAYDIWKEKIKVAENRIVRLGDKENFWPSEAKEKGPNGPCGPCSEIFFDLGPDKGCGKDACSPACDCGRFVEVWNLVFTQFNRKDNGQLRPLPQKNIDTGMGLERLTAIMQGRPNNFETDLFVPLLKEINSGVKREILPPTECRGQNDRGVFRHSEAQPKNLNGVQNDTTTQLIYAVSDHIRAIVFAIFDGIMPSNEARGYVVRKLIRKSQMHLRNLGIEKPFLYKLVPVLSDIMKVVYPELSLRRENIAEIILAEEKNFLATLKSSDDLLSDKFKEVLKKPDSVKAGLLTFQLYDTYGVPLELTKEWLERHNIEFSQEVFNRELEQQKLRSKSESAMKGEVFNPTPLHPRGVTGVTKFLRGKYERGSLRILKLIKDNQQVKKISQGDAAQVILDRTVFYAQAGGQIGDTGELKKGRNIFEVLDTKKIDKVVLHIGRVKQGSFKKSDLVSAFIDRKRRLAIARNHTATHLLQAALREILGPHVQQQGSLVSDVKLRFDFTHFKNISEDEIARIEELVNNFILDDYKVNSKQMPLSLAKKSGALAFFAEKYESKVRVVSIGDFSREFCAGTHLDTTREIGLFKILRESAIASGVRRIEAVTAEQALKLIKENEDILKDIVSRLNVPKERINDELQKRLVRIKELEKQLNTQSQSSVKSSADEFISKAEIVNNIRFIGKVIPDTDISALRKTIDLIKQRTDNSIIALGTANAVRVLLVIGITQDLCQKGWDASKLIPDIAKIVGGSGGGRQDFAQAGGNMPENLPRVFEELKSIIGHLR